MRNRSPSSSSPIDIQTGKTSPVERLARTSQLRGRAPQPHAGPRESAVGVGGSGMSRVMSSPTTSLAR